MSTQIPSRAEAIFEQGGWGHTHKPHVRSFPSPKSAASMPSSILVIISNREKHARPAYTPLCPLQKNCKTDSMDVVSCSPTERKQHALKYTKKNSKKKTLAPHPPSIVDITSQRDTLDTPSKRQLTSDFPLKHAVHGRAQQFIHAHWSVAKKKLLHATYTRARPFLPLPLTPTHMFPADTAGKGPPGPPCGFGP